MAERQSGFNNYEIIEGNLTKGQNYALQNKINEANRANRPEYAAKLEQIRTLIKEGKAELHQFSSEIDQVLEDVEGITAVKQPSMWENLKKRWQGS